MYVCVLIKTIEHKVGLVYISKLMNKELTGLNTQGNVQQYLGVID